MHLLNSSDEPLIVIVGEGGFWDIATTSELSERDKALFELLMNINGITEKTKPGTYHFNAVMLDDELFIVSLERVRESWLEPLKSWWSRIFHGV